VKSPKEKYTSIPDKGRIAYREYVLIVLMLTFSLQYLDRQIIIVLAEPIKNEFDLSDSQLGLLGGLVFGIPYSLMLIPVGVMVDRLNRRNILAGALFVWSFLTVLTGLARNLLDMILCRTIIAAAESSNNPSTLSMLSDYYDKRRRSTAIGIYYAAPAIATIIGFPVIGLIANNFGWRAAFLAAGIPGLLVTFLILMTVREPKREHASEMPARQKAPSLIETLKFIGSQKSLWMLMLAMMLTSFVVSAQIAWMSPLLMRTHGLNLVDAAIAISLAFGLMTTLGQISGGFIVDWLARFNVAWIGWFAAICAAGAGILMIASALSPQSWMAIALLACWAVPNGAHYGPIMGTVQGLVTSRMRGVTNSCMGLGINLLGAGLGPLAVGILSDSYSVAGDHFSIAWALASIALLQFVTMGLFYFASKYLKQDMVRAEAAVSLTS